MADFYYFKYEGRDPIKVVDFINLPSDSSYNDVSPVVITPKDFLNYEDENGITNWHIITGKYSRLDEYLLRSEISSWSPNLLINPGTMVMLPKDNTIIDSNFLQGNQILVQSGNFNYFNPIFIGQENSVIVSRNLKDKTVVEGDGITVNIVDEGVYVLLWVRSLNKIINISPFILDLNTSKDFSVGNFNLSLVPIKDYESIFEIGSQDIVNQFALDSREGFIDFFEKNLQQNDMIFIQVCKKIETKSDPFISDDLPSYSLNRSWDMIGLLDSVNVSYVADRTDKSINISGRDLVKVLIEDAARFIPYKYIEGGDVKNKLVWGGDDSTDVFKRNFVDGKMDYFFSYMNKPIKDSLSFIMNHLSNLGVVPDDLFMGDTALFSVPEDGTKPMVKFNRKGIWKIIQLAVDEQISNRLTPGEKLIKPEGDLLGFFNQICQKPFVEFFGDTDSLGFVFIVRQPPFTKSVLQEVVRNKLYYEIEESDFLGYNLQFDNTFYTSIKIEPCNQFGGIDAAVSESLIPVIFFSKYAEIWGNKHVEFQDQYISKLAMGSDNKVVTETFLDGLLNDYKLIIETHSYLPFTRKGSLSLNRDRRIKVGGFVLNKATNELFYVDSVTHSYSSSGSRLDKTTSINVSRGMKVPYILGGSYIFDKKIEDIPFTYFDIVDADLIIKNIKSVKDGSVENSKNINTNFTVNETAFDYFLKRKHFR